MEYFQKKLFYNISYEEYQSMLICLSARERRFQAGETIASFGDSLKSVGILSSGMACVVRYESNGSRTILEHLGPQDIFGENLAFQNPSYDSIHVVCEEACEILFIDYRHITSPCAKACKCHHQLIQNMLLIISEKTVQLSERIEVLSKRSIREKLLCYFLQLSNQSASDSFRIPFTMMDLADYLSVDRSAMTRELKKLKEEGIIQLEKRVVTLLPG